MLGKEFACALATGRIQSRGGFVEKQDLRVLHDPLGEESALPLAPGQRRKRLLLETAKVHFLDRLGDNTAGTPTIEPSPPRSHGDDIGSHTTASSMSLRGEIAP